MTVNQHELPGKGILLIEADVGLLRLNESAFAQAGWQVYTATDGPTGLQQFYTHQPDLVILELQLPWLDGWQVCGRIRQFSAVPIIILTRLNGSDNIIRALDEGADDYLVKPVEVNELMARARARLRRVALPEASAAPLFYSDGYLTIDLAKRSVLVRGQSVHLTKTEYDLLAYLFRHADRVLPHWQILEGVWAGQEYHPVDTVHLYIQRLRQKLGETARRPRYLLTEHGIGYRFKK